MGEPLTKSPTRERRGQRQPRRQLELANNIRTTLLVLGGEAHRIVVIEQVARDFGHDVRRIPDDLRTAVIRAFEEVVRDESMRAAYGFHLPFGDGSHRWAVKVPTELQH